MPEDLATSAAPMAILNPLVGVTINSDVTPRSCSHNASLSLMSALRTVTELECVRLYAPMNSQSTFNSVVTDVEVVLCVYCSIFFWNRAYNFSAVRGKLVQPKATFLT